MTNKPRRRSIRAITPLAPSPRGSFWGTIANYANELVPVAGPLLTALGETASAIERAEQSNRCMRVELAEKEQLLYQYGTAFFGFSPLQYLETV